MLRVSFVVSVLLLVGTVIVSGAELSERATPMRPLLSIPTGPTVKDFGAKGDGEADDTAAIEKAVKAGAGALYFPKGRYRLTRTIRVDLNSTGLLSLVGTGAATVIMAGPGPAFHFVGTHEGTAGPRASATRSG